MVQLGLNTTVTLPFIIEAATAVSEDRMESYTMDKIILLFTTLKECLSELLIRGIDQNDVMCLQQLAQIPFIPMYTVRNFVRTETDIDREWRLGYFYEAQMHIHSYYCCAASPIMHSSIIFTQPADLRQRDLFGNIMKWLKVNLGPDIVNVKENLEMLIQCFNNYEKQDIAEFLKQCFHATYAYLEKNCNCEDLTEFENAKCILYKSQLFKPQNIVLNMKYTYFPYLFQCQKELFPFTRFLELLKVKTHPTCESFNFVLKCIEEVMNLDECTAREHKLAKRAFSSLIQELREIPEGEVTNLMQANPQFWMLTTNCELIPHNSPSLYYNDDHSLLNCVSRYVQNLQIHVLAPLEWVESHSCRHEVRFFFVAVGMCFDLCMERVLSG